MAVADKLSLLSSLALIKKTLTPKSNNICT